MDVQTVETKGQLIAAINASAQVTFAAARENPVLIQFGTTKYVFHEGITEKRAKQLVRNVRRLVK